MRTGSDVRKLKRLYGFSRERLIRHAKYGQIRRAVALAHLIENALFVKELWRRKQVPSRQAANCWARIFGSLTREGCLEKMLKRSLGRNDGRLVAALAKAIEIRSKGASPAQAKVIEYLDVREHFGERIPTVEEMGEILIKNGTPASIPAIRSYYADAGVNPPAMKRGAPKGKRQNKSRTPHRVR